MDEYFGDRKEDDMEMSDGEDESPKKKKKATTMEEMVASANQGGPFYNTYSLFKLV